MDFFSLIVVSVFLWLCTMIETSKVVALGATFNLHSDWSDYMSVIGLISVLRVMELEDCVASCGVDTRCRSLFYNKEGQLCRLHDCTLSGSVTSLTTNAGSRYYKKVYQEGTDCVGVGHPDIYTWDPSLGVWYTISTEALSWHDSRDRCAETGGRLLWITDPTMNTAITTAMGSSFGMYWIDGYEQTPELTARNWTTHDGQAMTYYNWGGGEPNNDDEHCLQIYHNGKWNDMWCRHRCRFICQL